MIKENPVEKVTVSQSEGQGLLGNVTADPLLDIFGPSPLRTFLLCRFLSITIESGNAGGGDGGAKRGVGGGGGVQLCLWQRR